MEGVGCLLLFFLVIIPRLVERNCMIYWLWLITFYITSTVTFAVGGVLHSGTESAVILIL